MRLWDRDALSEAVRVSLAVGWKVAEKVWVGVGLRVAEGLRVTGRERVVVAVVEAVPVREAVRRRVGEGEGEVVREGVAGMVGLPLNVCVGEGGRVRAGGATQTWV